MASAEWARGKVKGDYVREGMEPTVSNLVSLLEGLRGLFCTKWEPLKGLQGRKMASFNRFLLAA